MSSGRAGSGSGLMSPWGCGCSPSCGLVPGAGGNGQPGPLLGPAAPPSTRGPPRRAGAWSQVRPRAVLWGESQLAEGRAGHVPRVTQLLNGRAERQTSSPELLAAASTSASPHALHPRAQPLCPPQGLLTPPACPASSACVCCRAPSLPEHSDSCEQGPTHPSRAAPACPILPAGWAGRPHGGRTQ